MTSKAITLTGSRFQLAARQIGDKVREIAAEAAALDQLAFDIEQDDVIRAEAAIATCFRGADRLHECMDLLDALLLDVLLDAERGWEPNQAGNDEGA